MKKILYIVSSLKKSGPNIQLLNLIQHLNKQEYEIVILTLSKNPSDSLFDIFEKLNIEIIEEPISKLSLPVTIGSIKSVISEINPDIIHSSGIRADYISSKGYFDVPTVSTVHNFMFDDYTYRYGKILGSLMINLHLKFLRKINVPIVCSFSIKELYKKKNHNFMAIQNGVDISKYQEVTYTEKKRLREKLNLPKNKKIMISTGHLTELKNPQITIEAFLKQKNNNESLLIFLGDGDLKNKLEEKYSKSKNIIFKGRVSNVSEYLQASDIFVSASYTEGLPNAVLEAMATNLYILLSNIRPHQEIYNFPEVSSNSFNPYNLNDAVINFEKALDKITDDNIILNRKVLIDNFSSEKMSYNYHKVYRSLNN